MFRNVLNGFYTFYIINRIRILHSFTFDTYVICIKDGILLLLKILKLRLNNMKYVEFKELPLQA